MSPGSTDKKQPLIDSGEPEQPPSLSGLAWRWIATVIFCLAVWAVLSPLIYERFFSDLGHGGDGWGVVLFTVCIIVPLLLVSVSATRKVVVKIREQYLPPVVPDHLPAEEVPVRGSAVKRISDRKKMRRAYLQKKGAANTLQTVGALIVLPSITIAVTLLVCAFSDATMMGVWLLGALIAGLVALMGRRLLQAGEEIENTAYLSYVPPVTPDTLPADEVLVRGADQPDAPTETLLRAAQSNEETASDQLLRVVPDATGELER